MSKLHTLNDMLQNIYGIQDLSTTCCRQCSCCSVACPGMKYSEAVNIIDEVWNVWTKEDKAKLLTTCVRYFFSKSLIKPCPMLDGVNCRIYDKRPLSCRIYGLWPKDAYDKRVDRFQKALGLPREQLPLNTQCELVRRKPQLCPSCNGSGGVPDDSNVVSPDCPTCKGKGKITPPPLTEEQIQEMYAALDKLDAQVGKLSKEKIDKNWNTRSLHDWILLRFFGEEMLTRMTSLAVQANDETMDAIMKIIEEQIEKIVSR